MLPREETRPLLLGVLYGERCFRFSWHVECLRAVVRNKLLCESGWPELMGTFSKAEALPHSLTMRVDARSPLIMSTELQVLSLHSGIAWHVVGVTIGFLMLIVNKRLLLKRIAAPVA
jgi:hypothetical protein